MEPYYYGRRGKETACGISRVNQTQFLMLAMVATMVCVVFWEMTPFSRAGLGQPLVLKGDSGSGFEDQSFLQTPPLMNEGFEGEKVLVESTTEEESERAPTQEEGSAQRAANKTLGEEASLTSVVKEEVAAPVARSREDLILESLESRPTAKPLEETEVLPKGRRRRKCDYYTGKWVLDNTRPLYSGKECEVWLSGAFSCRLHDHPDSLLDRYRWQPDGCDLPDFNATKALEMLRNKVVAFVGDSLGRQQVQSLFCMLTRGKNDTLITDVGTSYGFFKAPSTGRPNGYAHRFEATNTTFIFKWTVTLARIQALNESDPLTENALHLDRPEQFIEDHIGEVDVLVLNSGHHWNGGKMRENRFHFYLDGEPVSNKSELQHVYMAYNRTVHNVVRWVGDAVAGTDTVAFYRTLSPRHFRNGDWNTGGTCDNIRFESGVQVQEGNRTDMKAESAVRGTAVNLLNITSLSFERGEAHMSKYAGQKGGQDCLHWCLPGIPDTWNEIMLAELATKLKPRRSAGTNL